MVSFKNLSPVIPGGHTRHCLTAAFAMHDTLARKGDMHLTDFSEYVKG